jgi:ABC-type transporter Mla subunit MlaD
MPEDEFRTDLEWPTDPFGEPRERVDPDAPPEAATPPPATEPLVADALDQLAERLVARLHDLQVRLHADYDGLRSEVAALRTSVDEALTRSAEPATGAAAAAPSLTPVLEEIDRVRDEIASLKRRISLRADTPADTPVLTDEQLDRIARTVAGLLSRGTERAR